MYHDGKKNESVNDGIVISLINLSNCIRSLKHKKMGKSL